MLLLGLVCVCVCVMLCVCVCVLGGVGGQIFVVTNTWLSRLNTSFVATKVCLFDKTFVATKMILAAAPANDI